jgi:hypothetical protein
MNSEGPRPGGEATPYQVSATPGRFEVQDESGRTLVVCRDESSATDYAVLLSEAYRRGYKAGYRQAKRR